MSTSAITDRAADSQSAGSDTQQLVVFSLHDEHYALPITSVREIIRYTTPGAKGAAAGLVQGMINLRGSVLPVVDLGARLGIECEINDGTRILVVEIPGHTVGLIVDTVDEVLHVAADQIETLSGNEAAMADQIAKVGERLIVLLDTERSLAGLLD